MPPSTPSPSGGYEISSTTGVCAVGGDALQQGEPIIALLIEDPQRGFARLDIKLDRWDPASPPAPAGSIIGRWRTRASTRQRHTIEPGSLEELFDQAIEEGDGPRPILRYLLALMLMRKRRLVALESSRSSMILRRVGARSAEDPVEIPVPPLPEGELAEAGALLASLLGSVEPGSSEPGAEAGAGS